VALVALRTRLLALERAGTRDRLEETGEIDVEGQRWLRPSDPRNAESTPAGRDAYPRWHTALPVAEQSGRAGAATAIGVEEQRVRVAPASQARRPAGRDPILSDSGS
jgi:hypothetical protein